MKYKVNYTNNFKKQYKRIKSQGKKIEKLHQVIAKLSQGKKLDEKFKNHNLNNSKKYKNCYECHIEPDWLLVYKISDEKLILLLVETGSHSELF